MACYCSLAVIFNVSYTSINFSEAYYVPHSLHSLSSYNHVLPILHFKIFNTYQCTLTISGRVKLHTYKIKLIIIKLKYCATFAA